MKPEQVVILPGLDGTDLLLDRFITHAPAGYQAAVIPLPDDPTDDYGTLTFKLAKQIERLAPCHLIAESFSGPIGIRIASRFPEMVKQLTLVASFANSPMPWITRFLPWSMLLRLPLPTTAAWYFFGCTDREMVFKLRNAIRKTSAATLRKRIHCLMRVDVCSELESVRCPVRYLRPTRDRLVPERCLRRIRAAKRNMTVHELEGAHLLLQTYPEQAWLAITKAI